MNDEHSSCTTPLSSLPERSDVPCKNVFPLRWTPRTRENGLNRSHLNSTTSLSREGVSIQHSFCLSGSGLLAPSASRLPTSWEAAYGNSRAGFSPHPKYSRAFGLAQPFLSWKLPSRPSFPRRQAAAGLPIAIGKEEKRTLSPVAARIAGLAVLPGGLASPAADISDYCAAISPGGTAPNPPPNQP
jgi:hypothetical protein